MLRLGVILLAILGVTIPSLLAQTQTIQRLNTIIRPATPTTNAPTPPSVSSPGTPATLRLLPARVVRTAGSPGTAPTVGSPGSLATTPPPELAVALGTNTPNAPPKSPDDKLLQDLLKLKFDRTAPSILSALASQFDEAKGASPFDDPLNPLIEKTDNKSSSKEVEQFKQRLVVGDWVEVGKFLRTLTNDHGKQVYRYVLRELPNASKPGSRTGTPESPVPMPPQPGQGPANAGGPALVLDDILALAEAAPHDLEDEDARLLGQLLAKLLARGDTLEPFLPKLERGVKRLGGSDPEDRRRAAELLVAANRLIEAGAFLLPAETAREKQDWAALDLHARQLVAQGKRDKDGKLLTQAWEITQFILASTNAAASNREPALRRSFELMPQISREVGTNWLRRSFQDSPGQGLVILSAMSQMVQQGLTERAVDQRQKNLELQKQVVETFLGVADPAQPHWRAALTLLAQGWMQEGAYSRQRFQPRRTYGPQYDDLGNMIGYEQPPQYFDGNQFPAISVDQALNSAPSDQWLAQLDESLRLASFALIADMHLKAEAPDKALRYLEAFAARQPRAATDLANDFLRAWAKARSPAQQPRNMAYGPYGPVYYGMGSPYGMRGGSIPLTRAMQARNIRELSGLLRRLEALKLPALNDDAVVGAFSAAHSPAEVFRTDDMEAVFGPLEAAKLETLAGLAQTMRERLASQWRQPRLQQELKTQRNDKQIEAEMLRGYEVVMKLIGSGLKREPDHWQLNLAQAAANFDLAEFQYGRKADLSIYLEKREAAFKGFASAAKLYAAALPKIDEKEHTPKVFQQWFNASLGASDLAYVTRQQEPETNQLQGIQSAILSLPGAASEKHMATFAKQLGQSANTLKSELKPRYLRAGLRIVGEHPEAEDARKLATYYNDLLQELEFTVRLDGDNVVGHARPFGVFVSLHHTADVEREAGGFGRYLRNLKKSSPMYYSPLAAQQRNFVEDFDKQVREKLADKFEVKSITFLDDKVQSRGYGRIGWRETPLAYLLIQAKDGSADQVPALHMDLDFTDQRGQVVLPVESRITLLDARPDNVPTRPVANLEITQVLDDREVGKGLLALEIKASGKGLLPELPELLRTNFTNLRVEEVSDHGLAVTQIDTEGDDLAPATDRSWLIKLRVADDAPSSLAFHFPEAAVAGAKMIFKRYADADLVEVQPKLALAGLTVRSRPLWHWLVLAVVCLAVAGGTFLWLRRHQPSMAQVAPRYNLPEPMTPFAVIGVLRRMHGDSSLRWTEPNRTELARTIQSLETHFFGRERNGDPEPDLAGIGRRWVELAGNGK